MGFFNDQSPADTDAVKRGAGAIRSLKTQLNTLLGQIFDATGAFLPGWITGNQIADGAVGTDELADGAVASAKIANKAVTATQIADETITATQIAAQAVGTAEIADEAVGTAQIAAEAVGTAELADESVTAAKLAPGAAGFLKTGLVNSGFVPDGSGNSNVTITLGFKPDVFTIAFLATSFGDTSFMHGTNYSGQDNFFWSTGQVNYSGIPPYPGGGFSGSTAGVIGGPFKTGQITVTYSGNNAIIFLPGVDGSNVVPIQIIFTAIKSN